LTDQAIVIVGSIKNNGPLLAVSGIAVGSSAIGKEFGLS